MNKGQIFLLKVKFSLDKNWERVYSIVSTQPIRVLTPKGAKAMDERKKRVLNAIINDYIANAEPVGSRTITKRYDLGVSPATIRNEMSDLTDEGYIEQPHTSAGRIPSAKGYRYYVDNLMEKERLTPKQLAQIREVMVGELSEINNFMRSCVNMISKLTSYTALATISENAHGYVKNIQLLPINEQQIMVILFVSTGLVRHKLIEVSYPISSDELMSIERGLYNALVDKDVNTITAEKLRDLVRELHLRDRIPENAVTALQDSLLFEQGQRIFTGGTMNMFAQPEFRDVDRLQNIFSLLEKDKSLKELLDAASPHDNNLTVTIGHELQVDDVKDCSMVVANYFINGEKAGSIGVLGPTRMSYGRTVSLMKQIADELSKTMSDQKNK